MKLIPTRLSNQAHKLAILVIILSLALYWIYIHWNNPASFYTIKYDPEYAYFMNSLSVFKGQPYSYVDHPGTPVELLGTAILLVSFPFTGGSLKSFITYHISNPELFLTIARAFIGLMSIGCVYLYAKHSIKLKSRTDEFFSIAIATTFYALLPPLTFTTLTLWSHNSFNFPLGSLLLLGLLVRLRSNLDIKWWEISLFGIGAGILTAIQLYFATWVIGICLAVSIFCLLNNRGWKKAVLSSIIGAVSSLFGFFIVTLPVLHKYISFYAWVRNLLSHQGRYGLGEAGFTTPSRLQQNFIWLWEQAPIVFLAAGISLFLIIATLLFHRRNLKRHPGLWGAAIGLGTQLLVTLLIILKHPGAIYLLAVAAIVPILLCITYTLLANSNRYFRPGFAVLGVLILFGFLFGMFQAIDENEKTISSIHRVENELRELRSSYSITNDIDINEQTILWSYGTGSKCFALNFGNVFSNNAFSKEIRQVCPNEGRYDVWSDGDQLTAPEGWHIIIIPEKYLPDDAQEYGTVEASTAKTSYGQVLFIIADREE